MRAVRHEPSHAGLPFFGGTAGAVDGKQIVERLEFMDNAQRLCRYTNVSGLGVTDYTGTFDLKPKGRGSSVEWRFRFLPTANRTLSTKTIVATLMKTGFEALTKRFGALK
jgi:Polyketide cyclase / dehydrase and lipid transport